MNQDLCEKNKNYQGQIIQVTTVLFHAFYYDEEERLNHLPAAETYERDSIHELLPKGEKIFDYFGNAESAIKALRFLHTVSPVKAKEIVDEL